MMQRISLTDTRHSVLSKYTWPKLPLVAKDSIGRIKRGSLPEKGQPFRIRFIDQSKSGIISSRTHAYESPFQPDGSFFISF